VARARGALLVAAASTAVIAMTLPPYVKGARTVRERTVLGGAIRLANWASENGTRHRAKRKRYAGRLNYVVTDGVAMMPPRVGRRTPI
jgi:hypothetical protein